MFKKKNNNNNNKSYFAIEKSFIKCFINGSPWNVCDNKFCDMYL